MKAESISMPLEWSMAVDLGAQKPMLTIERKGDALGKVVVHWTAEELEEPAKSDGLARLALEIARLRQEVSDLRHDLERQIAIGTAECN